MSRPLNYEDPEDLARHPDVAVRAWNQKLSGDSVSCIMRQFDLSRPAVTKILQDPPPGLIANDLRYRTGLDAFWITQGGREAIRDEDGNDFAFIVILEPPTISARIRTSGFREIHRSVRSGGLPGFSLGAVAEKASMASLLRMVHNKGYPAWEIDAQGGAAPYDGRFAHMLGVENSWGDEAASPTFL